MSGQPREIQGPMSGDAKEAAQEFLEINPSSSPGEDKMQTLFTSWRDPYYRRKFIYTVYITISFGMLGLVGGQRGPAFLDLQIVTSTNVETASAFFTAGSVGLMFGSLVGGVLFDRFNKSLLMFATALGSGVATGVIPLCTPYGLMIFAQVAWGVFNGALATCGNASLIHTWGKSGRSAMQTAHFVFAFGGIFSPLITKPFLASVPKNTSSADDQVVNITVPYQFSTKLPVQANISQAEFEDERTTMVHYAFLITAVLTSLSSLPFLVTCFQGKPHKKKRSSGETTLESRDLPMPIYILTLVLMCVTFFLFIAVENSFASFLMTFVVKGQYWSKVKGTNLTSAFWASFAGGRFLGIFFVKLISTVKLLFLCCTTLLLFFIGFLMSAHYVFSVGIWTFTVGAGFAMSLIFPCGFTWAEDELMKVTGKVASVVTVSSSAGAMMNPILIGYLMGNFSPNWYSYVLTAESGACLIMYSVIFIYARTFLKKKRQNASRALEIQNNELLTTVEHTLMEDSV